MNTTFVWKINLGNTENVYELKMPTVGQLWDIERLKLSALGESYSKMAVSGAHLTGNFAADHADISAYVTVLTPDLLSDMKVKNYADLGLKHASLIYKEFYGDNGPWVWIQEFYGVLMLSDVEVEESKKAEEKAAEKS